MLLSNATLLYQIDGISIEHGHQDAVESENWTASRHCLVLHISATVQFECFANGNSYERRIVPGDIHIIPQGMSLTFRFRGPTELLVLSFDHAMLLSVAPAIVTVPDWQLAPHFCLRDSQITSLLHAVRDAVRAGCSSGDPHIRNLGNVLLHYLAMHYSEGRDGPSRPIRRPASKASALCP
jgi:hypothetical protein